MPRQGYVQTPEHRAKIRAAVKATWASVPSRAAQRGVASLVHERILDALPGRASEIASRTGIPHNTVRGYLGRLAREGVVTQERVRGASGVGQSYMYTLVEGERR